MIRTTFFASCRLSLRVEEVLLAMLSSRSMASRTAARASEEFHRFHSCES